jgi:hypothetical protein
VVVRAAATKAFALGALGYQIVGFANSSERQDNVVECKAGFDAEAATLARNVGMGTTVARLPSPPPTGAGAADCAVILGTSATATTH